MYLSAPDGDGARMGGMATPGERSIHLVTENKPKVLRGLSQQGHCSGYKESSLPCHGQYTLPVDRARLPPPLLLRRNMATPYVSRGKASRKGSP